MRNETQIMRRGRRKRGINILFNDAVSCQGYLISVVETLRRIWRVGRMILTKKERNKQTEAKTHFVD